MDEQRLIETLRQGRGTPPPAAPDEWFRVAKATVGAPVRRPARGWAWGLGLGLCASLAALWMLLPPRPQPAALAAAPALEAAPVPSDGLNQALESLGTGEVVSDTDTADHSGDAFLQLLDEV
jgi:hypothetical protein